MHTQSCIHASKWSSEPNLCKQWSIRPSVVKNPRGLEKAIGTSNKESTLMYVTLEYKKCGRQKAGMCFAIIRSHEIDVHCS